MRFIENGPQIPDELLIARDEGRVVFFCGAGVSRAKAGLPDFFGLAERVIEALGVGEDSPVFKLLNEAREIDDRVGATGLISADRLFGLLEREFLVSDIVKEVAAALKPKGESNLDAHNTLLDLATSPEGVVRLVTTNFDLLFDDCGRKLHSWQPPRLPEFTRENEFEGVVYLHGKVNTEYNGVDGDGFVLSSSEFGRAYLAEGWATAFFREVINNYVVVFVGYAADDPPIHYLLEALHKTDGQLDGVYAFQSGTADEAAAKWRHKGVEAISYDEADRHKALWQTLDSWAARARDVDKWYADAIDAARAGPRELQPHQRGQVAHIVSTVEGMRRFAEGDTPPPAEWLCVFDPARRYAASGYADGVFEGGEYVDPFDFYCIDSDASPGRAEPKAPYTEKREIPVGAWDAFSATQLDKNGLPDDSLPSLRGYFASRTPRLYSRLQQMGNWIAKVAGQPAAIWWACFQFPLHPDVCDQIRWEVERAQHNANVRKAWRYLFEHWENSRDEFNSELHELNEEITKEGWNHRVVRRYEMLMQPRIGLDGYRGLPVPVPAHDVDEVSFNKLIRLAVKYPEVHEEVEVSDEWLSNVVAAQRNNLELAVGLESELGLENLIRVDPINMDAPDEDEYYERYSGISGSVLRFSQLFERLLEIDHDAAQREFARWRTDDEMVFARLRIWAVGKPEVLSVEQVGALLMSLTDDVFWDYSHTRDLLLSLSARWESVRPTDREDIVARILKGPPQSEWEDSDKFKVINARAVLSWINWLAQNGCVLPIDLAEENKQLMKAAPGWREESVVKFLEPMAVRSGWVKTNTDGSSLLHEPLGMILSRSLALMQNRDETFVENAPFTGFLKLRPVRAFSALRQAVNVGDVPVWAWRTFLGSKYRCDDRPKFMALIAERMTGFDDTVLGVIIREVTAWLLNGGERLAADNTMCYENLIARLIGLLEIEPNKGASSIIRGAKSPNWEMEALNSPVGDLARVLMKDPCTENLDEKGALPSEWLGRAGELLQLPGDMRRHAMVNFTRNLNWFYAWGREWCEENLLSVLDGESVEDIQAFWSGFFRSRIIPGEDLYIRLKPYFAELATKGDFSRRKYREVLAAFILAGWGSIKSGSDERLISDGEFRAILLSVDDEFRVQILWQVRRWLSDTKERDGRNWSDLSLELVRNVWPKQKKVKSSRATENLCKLVFANEELFPELVEAVSPHITKLGPEQRFSLGLLHKKDEVVARYPEQILSILYTVLPDSAVAWPYRIDDVLKQIAEADESLMRDGRYIELKRRWDVR